MNACDFESPCLDVRLSTKDLFEDDIFEAKAKASAFCGQVVSRVRIRVSVRAMVRF